MQSKFKDYYKLWHPPKDSYKQHEEQQRQEQHVTAGSDTASQEHSSRSSSITNSLPTADADLCSVLTAEWPHGGSSYRPLARPLSSSAVAEDEATLKLAHAHTRKLQQQQQYEQSIHENKSQQQ